MEFETLQVLKKVSSSLEDITFALYVIAVGGAAISAFMLLLIGAIATTGEKWTERLERVRSEAAVRLDQARREAAVNLNNARAQKAQRK